LCLTAEELLLLINIFLRDVASRNQRVNARLSHMVSVLAETHIATDSILVAELIVLSCACVLHSLGDGDRFCTGLASDAQNKDGGEKQTHAKRSHRGYLFFLRRMG